MQKVGYDMYVRLLDEVTKELSGEKLMPEKEIKMELNLSAFISENYISSQEERIVFYNRISKIASEEELSAIYNSLQQQYGEPPQEVTNLCKIAYLKNLARNFNVQKVRINSAECLVFFYKSSSIIDERLSKMGDFYETCLKFEDVPILKVEFKGKVISKLEGLIGMFERALTQKI